MTCLFELYLGMIGPVFVLYLYQLGFDAFQCNILLGTSLLSQFFCEIPCGVFSDRFGRRATIFLGGMILIVSNVIFILSHNFGFIFLAQILNGISFALYSGSLDAWISDNIEKNEIKDVFVKKNQYLSVMMIITGVCGSVLADIDMKFVFISCVISEFFFVYFTFRCIKNVNVDKQKSISSKKIFVTSMKDIKKNKAIKNILIYNVILTVAISPVFVYWSPILSQYSNETNMKLAGIVWLLMRVGLLLGNNLIQLLKRDILFQLFMTTLCCSLVLLSMTFTNSFYLYIGFIIAFEIILGMMNALKEFRINYVINQNKATLLSVNSFFVTIGNYCSIFIYGIIANLTDYKFCILLGGIVLLFYCGWTFLFLKQDLKIL